MSKFIIMIKNWKTTIIGFLPFLVALLNSFGVIDLSPEELTEAVASVFDNIGVLLTGVLALIGLFSKDADKSSKDLGI